MSSSTSATNARFYDAVALLRPSPQETDIALADGEIAVSYDGWSLQELRDMRPDLMHAQDWYNKYPWSSVKLPSGIYVVRLPIPGSNRKTFDEQTTLLLPGEEPAHVVLAATALLAIRLSGGQDPLRNGWTRCKEQTVDGVRVELYWYDGRLCVYNDSDDDRDDDVWLASARKTS